MAKFKEGDLAKVVSIVKNGSGHEHLGKIVRITTVYDDGYVVETIDGNTLGSGWQDCELKLINERENMGKMKYYQVKQDTPLWFKGAILECDEDNGDYTAINDLWDVPEDGLNGEFLAAPIVEKNPDWFERVYEMSKAGKAVYVTKEVARGMATNFFKVNKTKTATESKKAK